MKKKNIFSLGNILYALSAVLGVLAICMIFATSLNITGSVLGLSDETSFSGINATFGYASNDIDYLGFSFMNMLSYILVIAAVVLLILKLCGVVKNQLADYVVVALFVLSTIFFFLTSNFVVLNENFAKSIETLNKVKEGTVVLSLGAGAIVSAISSAVAAILVVVKNVLKTKKSK